MYETIERPAAGKPMKAAWGARLADRVNELCAAVSPGTLVREGLGGFGAEPIPTSRRVGRSSATASAKLPFEPEFEDVETTGNDGEKKKEIRLKAVGSGYIPWGRRFYPATPEIDGDANDGLLGLEITHPTSASAIPTAKIVNCGGTNGVVTPPSDAVTVIPLYKIKDGKIETDYRCYLALAIRE